MKRRNIVKVGVSLVFFISYFLSKGVCAFPVVATGNGTSITKEQIMKNVEKDKTYDFEELISENGKEYVLKDVSYTIVDTHIPENEEIVKFDKKYEGLESNNVSQLAETLEIDRNNEKVAVFFKSADWTSRNIGGTSQTVTDKYNKGYTAEQPTDFDRSRTVSVTDPTTGVTKNVTVYYVNTTLVEDYKWRKSDLELPITFYNYDAPVYNFGDFSIPHNDDYPQIEGVEDELIKLLGYDTKKYKITGAKWVGGTYTNSDGIKCREAIASCDTYTALWQANYEGVADFSKTVYDCTAHYEGTVKVKDKDKATTYDIKATAIYELKPVVTTTTKATTTTTTTTAPPETTKVITQTVPHKESKSVITPVSVAVGGGGITVMGGVVGFFYFTTVYVVVYDSKNKRICSCKIGKTGKINLLKAVILTKDTELIVACHSNIARRKLDKFGEQFYIKNKPLDFDREGDKYRVYIRVKKEND